MNSKSILLREASLIDGVSETNRGPVDVLVEDGSIRRIGRINPSTDMTVVDAAGLTLLPGLIDTHVHICLDGSLDPIGHLRGEPSCTTLLKAVKNAAQCLDRGVTTVRDLGGPAGLPLALRDAIGQGVVPGPTILTAGQVVTTTGGHCYFMGHEADDAAGARKAARIEMKAGVDWIKVMATGGELTPGSGSDVAQYDVDELEMVVADAHARGRRVATHAHGLAGIRNSVNAGVDSIEHGTFVDRDTLVVMRDRGTWWVPTMTPARMILEEPGRRVVPEERLTRADRNWSARRHAVIEGIGLGVRTAAGTDAGVTLTGHGWVAIEIETFHDLGMDPMQAIWTGTRLAAELIGIDGRVGTIQAGKQADLILVEGDPLSDLSRLREPLLVMKAGEIVKDRLQSPKDR